MRNNNSIGGFFELELPPVTQEYHSKAYRFNLARNALLIFLKAVDCKKVYLPAYCCASLANTLRNSSIKYLFYNIDEAFEPKELPILSDDEYFLYVNYFGIKSKVLPTLLDRYGNQLIVDNSQSFFSEPIIQACNIYSARKFFGVPDGAYLYTPEQLSIKFELQPSQYSTQHLIQRIEQGPEDSYLLYKQSESILKSTGPAKMSTLSRRILSTIDYDRTSEQRRSNFRLLHESLYKINLLTNVLSDELSNTPQLSVPMIYPLVVENGNLLRQYLINHKIFVAKYWQDVLENESSSELETFYVENLIPLPIDQRYSRRDILKVIDTIFTFYT